MSTFKWVPEAPNFPGVYAITPTDAGGNYTTIVNDALKFDTEAECQKWCDEHPHPRFVPREHGWTDKPKPTGD